LLTIGFSSEEIKEVVDGSSNDLEELLVSEWLERIKAMASAGNSVLLFLVYIGHGVRRKGMVHVVDSAGNARFNIEDFS